MAELFTNLARAIASEVTRRADSDGNVPRSATFEIQQAANQHVQRMFLGRNQRGELAPFDTLINGAVIPLSPYMRQLWESIRAAVRIPVEQAAVILANKLPADVLAVTLVATRNPFVAAKAKVSEQVFRPNPLVAYDAPHTWVDPNGYRLSDRVWNSAAATRRHLDVYLDTAIREGKGALQMSRDLERFLTPGRTLPTTNAPYGTNASFDGMRLARTEISQASQRAHIVSAAMNPFVDGLKWNLSASHPHYDICDKLASGGPNGDGVYEIATYPSRPHPQCLCYSTNVMVDAKTSDALIDELRADIQSARAEFVNLVGPAQVDAFERLLMGQGLEVERSGVAQRAMLPIVTPVAPVVAPVVAEPAIPPAQAARQRIAEIERQHGAQIAQLDAELERVHVELREITEEIDRLGKLALTLPIRERDALFQPACDRRQALLGKQKAVLSKYDDAKKSLSDRILSVVQVDQPGKITMNAPGASKAIKQNWQNGVDEFNRLVGEGVSPALPADFLKKAGRAHYNPTTKNLRVKPDTDVRVIVHELGHWLEDHNPEVHRKAVEFYDRRTAGESLARMGRGYGKDEKTRFDKFLDPYMGKEYLYGGDRYATEIVSMGAEYFYNQTARLAVEDPDMFDFIFNLFRGL